METQGESKEKDCHSQGQAKRPAQLMALHSKDNEVQLHRGSVNFLPHSVGQVSLS